jgi:lipoyl(octanoyl) transferase
MRELEVQHLGLMPYGEAYAHQQEILKCKKRDHNALDHLLFVEHPDVYTFGRKSKDGIPAHLPNAFEVERGGEATFHNPGQMVVYPILTLEGAEKDVHRYLRTLEAILMEVLAGFGVTTEQKSGATGVWIKGESRKIASIGVAISSWVTYHGIALNVNNDLSGFSKISPCGFSADVMTSLKKELGEGTPSTGMIKEAFTNSFCRHFERELRYSHVDRKKTG